MKTKVLISCAVTANVHVHFTKTINVHLFCFQPSGLVGLVDYPDEDSDEEDEENEAPSPKRARLVT